jgi:hypothetical protein
MNRKMAHYLLEQCAILNLNQLSLMSKRIIYIESKATAQSLVYQVSTVNAAVIRNKRLGIRL